jgi:hypothetical protein
MILTVIWRKNAGAGRMGSCVGVGVLGAIFNSIGSNWNADSSAEIWVSCMDMVEGSMFLVHGTVNTKDMKIKCPCNT